jgi:hypothetical protein
VPTVLPLYANAVRSLFDEPRFVDDADGTDWPVARRRHQLFRENGLNFSLDALRTPRRIRQENLPTGQNRISGSMCIAAETPDGFKTKVQL